jgi:hypothetical protein
MRRSAHRVHARLSSSGEARLAQFGEKKKVGREGHWNSQLKTGRMISASLQPENNFIGELHD